jgi:hypothetical protein
MMTKSSGRRAALAGLVAAAAATGILVAGATAAAAAPSAAPAPSADNVQPQSTETTLRAFTVTLPPWHSVKIPKAACPAGMNLVDRDLSPGRIVPRGVEVKEPGAIGVTISQASYWSYYDERFEYRVYTGLSGSDIREATNWDPFASHDLTIDLHCTSNLANSYIGTFAKNGPLG